MAGEEPGETPIAAEADWAQAPNILDGATEVELSPFECDLEYWLKNVAQGSLMGLAHGRRPGSTVPDFLRADGPLRDSLIAEMAFRSLSEEAATKACALITLAAKDVAGMEFYATQTLDEARHAQSFRYHLTDLGVPEDELVQTLERVAGAERDSILEPLWEWGLPAFDDNFINGVVIVTVLLEGVLAPTTELSERKWKPLSEATADIERGACVDEIRHLAVGSWFVRDHVARHGEAERRRVLELITEGRARWESLPTIEVLMKRETLFQQGMEQHGELIGDYELAPGRRLVDTTAEERVGMAATWSLTVQESRLRYMGLEEVTA
jgi:hypothetical protein